MFPEVSIQILDFLVDVFLGVWVVVTPVTAAMAVLRTWRAKFNAIKVLTVLGLT